MSSLIRIAAAALALLTLAPIAGAQASAQITPLKPTAVKWILPPRTSSFYTSEKAFAESMGYETVEHDGRP